MRPMRVLAALAAAALVAAGPVLAQGVPDFTRLGFPRVVASQQIEKGAAATISARVTGGSISVQIPAGTFGEPVRFEILTGPLNNLAVSSSIDAPQLGFAFRVTGLASKQLIGTFLQPITVTATAPTITANSSFYDIGADGRSVEDRRGLAAQAGTLTHRISLATVGWAITTPKGEAARIIPAVGMANVRRFALVAGVLLLMAAGVTVLWGDRRERARH